jgi:hypothetical protein
MSKPDLDTVTQRRAALVREVAELEKHRAELEAEEQELMVAERVLKRLAGDDDELLSIPNREVVDGPIRAD